MKLTNLTMINLLNSISKFPYVTGKIGYAFARNKRILSSELSDFESARNSLLEKYGEKNEEGYYIDPNNSKNANKYQKEITEVLNTEIEVNLMQINDDEYEMPYSEDASVQDYDIIELFLVKKKEEV